jgi:hypothetical protein
MATESASSAGAAAGTAAPAFALITLTKAPSGLDPSAVPGRSHPVVPISGTTARVLPAPVRCRPGRDLRLRAQAAATGEARFVQTPSSRYRRGGRDRGDLAEDPPTVDGPDGCASHDGKSGGGATVSRDRCRTLAGTLQLAGDAAAARQLLDHAPLVYEPLVYASLEPTPVGDRQAPHVGEVCTSSPGAACCRLAFGPVAPAGERRREHDRIYRPRREEPDGDNAASTRVDRSIDRPDEGGRDADHEGSSR